MIAAAVISGRINGLSVIFQDVCSALMKQVELAHLHAWRSGRDIEKLP